MGKPDIHITRRGFLKCGAATIAAAVSLRYAPTVLAGATQSNFDVSPCWSPPDGNSILYSSNQGYETAEDPYFFQLWTMDQAGNQKSRLTYAGDNNDASWSPNGSKIAWINRVGKRSYLMSMNPDGSDKRKLTDGIQNPYNPAWTPDGKYIAFALGKPDNNGYTQHDGNQIWIMSADGNNSRRLVTGREFVILNRLIWSKDGEYLAIEEFGDYIGGVHVYHPETETLKTIVRSGADSISWTPTKGGHEITYAVKSSRRSPRNLWSYRIEDGSTRLIADSRDAYSPQWSQNGFGIIYAVDEPISGVVKDSSLPLDQQPLQTPRVQIEKRQGATLIPFNHLNLIGPNRGTFYQTVFDWRNDGSVVFSASPPGSNYPDYWNTFHVFNLTPDNRLVQLTS